MKTLFFSLFFLANCHGHACERPIKPQFMSVFWRKENIIRIVVVNRAYEEDDPISIVVKIDGNQLRKFGPYDTSLTTEINIQLEGLSPSAHTFALQSVSGKTSCQSEETEVQKLESWYEHTHQPDYSERVLPFNNYNPGPPPN